MNLSSFEMQIISKYLDFKDVEKLINISPDLKYYYHTTFELITINYDYIVPKQQVKLLINKLLSIFPNLEEIILNITSNINIIPINGFKYILSNYINFTDVIKSNFSNNINVKIQFNKPLDFINILYDSLLDIKIYLPWILKLCKNNNIYIYIIKLWYFSIRFVKFDINYYKEVFNLIKQYSNIKFVLQINDFNDINKLYSHFDDNYMNYIKSLKNIYIAFNYDKELYFQFDQN